MYNPGNNREALLKAGLSLAVLEELGFELAPQSTLVSKMRRVSPTGSTAMRDSLMQGISMMLKLYQVLAELETANVWNFVHVCLQMEMTHLLRAALRTLVP